MIKYFNCAIGAGSVVLTAFILVGSVQARPARFLKPAYYPEVGVFLVAKRGLTDPNFRRRVLLLVQHNDRGSLGVIVNRRSRWTLLDVIPSLGRLVKRRTPVYIGGPVRMNRASFLWRSKNGLSHLRKVVPGVYFGNDRRDLERILKRHPGDYRFRIYVGYAGWVAGQLSYEIRRGDWHMLRAEPAYIFSGKPGSLWQRLINRIPHGGMIVSTSPTTT
ncbi:MAG: YqgE/AlgH family protein [Gammaproteobacteria bacterium]|nr:MAG: YqgE/AlgH family protein [Gammaproteobacteria bacterium]